ncbi:hypothetical protein UFOVP75_198 [uncultured Caudovirales phage]|uniref:Uncharacterized protein n=1 Tax=uncultured Caudovirales phage TaxID=2100421 RepID=A0A6J5KZF1_9CAUD|nr:hypothetical protein UFOVP75_198 [uncultured Caudovirales phage]
MAEVSYLKPAAYFKVKFHDVSPTKNQNPYFLGEHFGFTPTELWLGFREYFPMEYLKQLERHER